LELGHGLSGSGSCVIVSGSWALGEVVLFPSSSSGCWLMVSVVGFMPVLARDVSGR